MVVEVIVLATTTTTTLPDSCAPPDSLAAALCQLEALGNVVAAGVPSGRLRDHLSGLIAKASSLAAASGGQQTGRLRRKSLKRALSALKRFQKQLRTKKARHEVATETLTVFADDATQIATILTTLRAH